MRRTRDETAPRSLGNDQRLRAIFGCSVPDGLRESADGFSRTIGNVSISNLRGLSVKVVENFEVTRHYRSVAEAGGAADLLTDLTETESAISDFRHDPANTGLRLADWFGVQLCEDGRGNRNSQTTCPLNPWNNNGYQDARKYCPDTRHDARPAAFHAALLHRRSKPNR
ncbi:MAG: hypothetical protein IPP85_09810 [Propionivibrio sp.]|nr:hypothetical protein [Propionivibrio sp.]